VDPLTQQRLVTFQCHPEIFGSVDPALKSSTLNYLLSSKKRPASKHWNEKSAKPRSGNRKRMLVSNVSKSSRSVVRLKSSRRLRLDRDVLNRWPVAALKSPLTVLKTTWRIPSQVVKRL
jgi:hypothetical protein